MIPDNPDPAAVAGASTRRADAFRGFGKLVIAAVVLSAFSAILSIFALLFATGFLQGKPQQADFERQARAYLLGNPDVIIEAVNGLQERQKTAEANELTAIIAARGEEIFNDPTSPVGGNPQGDATLVEFFDYNCPYCRKAAPMLEDLAKSDDGLRLVFKEFPILGPDSNFAAHAALASRNQGKYWEFHNAMMAYDGAITQSSTLEVAAQVGLDIERLKKDMDDPSISEAISRNTALAEALRISGTPGFVVGKEILRGLADPDTMKRLIAEARQR
jgi:protein-disulfide isomerase